ncbi:CLUMA_CG018584, isoform A [Clunio marinus]|uniref:CLUMA_CG018584, isoform A n=1 Tax=Clunio marinus TaxID=568069 RepID=A0A1J1J016_9DIPT|nr:CLUMA_CG018584, isoform A [Clunio marinus]
MTFSLCWKRRLLKGKKELAPCATESVVIRICATFSSRIFFLSTSGYEKSYLTSSASTPATTSASDVIQYAQFKFLNNLKLRNKE